MDENPIRNKKPDPSSPHQYPDAYGFYEGQEIYYPQNLGNYPYRDNSAYEHTLGQDYASYDQNQQLNYNPPQNAYQENYMGYDESSPMNAVGYEFAGHMERGLYPNYGSPVISNSTPYLPEMNSQYFNEGNSMYSNFNVQYTPNNILPVAIGDYQLQRCRFAGYTAPHLVRGQLAPRFVMKGEKYYAESSRGRPHKKKHRAAIHPHNHQASFQQEMVVGTIRVDDRERVEFQQTENAIPTLKSYNPLNSPSRVTGVKETRENHRALKIESSEISESTRGSPLLTMRSAPSHLSHEELSYRKNCSNQKEFIHTINPERSINYTECFIKEAILSSRWGNLKFSVHHLMNYFVCHKCNQHSRRNSGGVVRWINEKGANMQQNNCLNARYSWESDYAVNSDYLIYPRIKNNDYKIEIVHFHEDLLLYLYYSEESASDLKLSAIANLYAKKWRFNTRLRIWMKFGGKIMHKQNEECHVRFEPFAWKYVYTTEQHDAEDMESESYWEYLSFFLRVATSQNKLNISSKNSNNHEMDTKRMMKENSENGGDGDHPS